MALLVAPGHADKEGPAVPRFVSMRVGEVNLHVGPGTKYPVAWVFLKKNLPVEVIQEFESWLRIRDVDGAEGWVMGPSLQSKRSVLVTGGTRILHQEADAGSAAVAQLEIGVIAQLDKCPAAAAQWCRVTVANLHGWIRRSEIWGVYPSEIYPAP